MNKRPLAPKFLNKLDNSLLLNRPDTWSTRFHLVFYYTIIFMIALAIICLTMPSDAREKSFYALWSGSIGVLVAIGFIVWLVYLFRFNVFKQYGSVFPGDRLKTFLLYFFIIALLSIVVYIPPVIESIKADLEYNTETIAKDCNRINELITQLEQDNVPTEWQPDTLIRTYGTNPSVGYREGVEYLDSNSFRSRVINSDSASQIQVGVVVVYSFFDLNFVNDYRINQYATYHAKTTKQLYHANYLNRNFDKVACKNELQKLLSKYSSAQNRNNYYYPYNTQYNNNYNNNSNIDVRQNILEKYRMYDLGFGIENISTRKFRLYDIRYSDHIRFIYYFSLVIALLVFVFRHSTIKAFFLSLLTAAVLSILSGLFVAILNFRETGIFILMLLYFLIFLLLAARIFKSNKRSLISGIALNAVVLMIPFIPIIIVGFYYSINTYQYYEYGNFDYNPEYYLQKQLHFTIAEISGGLILLVLIETLFKRLFRLWYASPED